ncbi:RimJ/RimL family protein N-acetyltransferase [Streptacidiphilus sp. MAP12-16]|uniref:GNAT family N-acetyltransferase n=1 Tax=Streptacidiphilus sp. MAP12-16 TaxID=3156300 RepID=UPI00351827FF
MTSGTSSVSVARTDRIELREITPSAAAALTAGDDGGFAWAPGGPYEGTRDACTMIVKAAQAGVYNPLWGAFAIIRLADGAAVGGVGFHGPPSDGVVEIGYDLADSARGHGFATEAARLVTAYALAHPEVACVLAHTEPANAASQAVLLRAGFERDGLGEDDLYRFVLRG